MAAYVPGHTNEVKIKLYERASESEIVAWDTATDDHTHTWQNNPSATYRDALAVLDQIRPMRPGMPSPSIHQQLTTAGLGGGGTLTKTVYNKEKTLWPALDKVTSEPNWIEAIVAQHQLSFNTVVPGKHKLRIARDMNVDRRQPAEAELIESATDHFHISEILKPAVNLARAMLDEGTLTVGYPPMSNHTKGDLLVYTPLTSEDQARKGWASIEDKRLEVFEAHCDEFRSYGTGRKFPWPTNEAGFENASSGKRMWIQIWGQMQEYGVNYAKLFSISGVIYVRRSEKNPNELILSKTYTSLDGEVTRSLCMILEARERAKVESARAQTISGRLDLFSRRVRAFVFGWITKWKLLASLFWGYCMGSCAIYVLFNHRTILFQDISREVSITRRYLPTLFTQFVGEGASGVVWRSLSGSRVVKIFNKRETALREAKILEQARDLPVPTLQGVVEGGSEFGAVMSYEGTPIGDLDRATLGQRHQLLRALKSLHARGIHHHDIRGSNVLVGPRGTVTIIDFDRAELDSKCLACSDTVLRQKLEADPVSGYINGYMPAFHIQNSVRYCQFSHSVPVQLFSRRAFVGKADRWARALACLWTQKRKSTAPLQPKLEGAVLCTPAMEFLEAGSCQLSLAENARFRRSTCASEIRSHPAPAPVSSRAGVRAQQRKGQARAWAHAGRRYSARRHAAGAATSAAASGDFSTVDGVFQTPGTGARPSARSLNNFAKVLKNCVDAQLTPFGERRTVPLTRRYVARSRSQPEGMVLQRPAGSRAQIPAVAAAHIKSPDEEDMRSNTKFGQNFTFRSMRSGSKFGQNR
ncbi:hypothetical protein GGX14DRAFT_398355 [Mycena pura]|uniref:Protein kinase domain-containing protein n=1 Tax=Mycena pura TaxID=153505 RepID=A0AAD6Y7Q9_9AGAR|nr:hypothetical protein GGX14DRAFT_398355 [Mycena pura]